jgi:hypothetical protein
LSCQQAIFWPEEQTKEYFLQEISLQESQKGECSANNSAVGP